MGGQVPVPCSPIPAWRSREPGSLQLGAAAAGLAWEGLWKELEPPGIPAQGIRSRGSSLNSMGRCGVRGGAGGGVWFRCPSLWLLLSWLQAASRGWDRRLPSFFNPWY